MGRRRLKKPYRYALRIICALVCVVIICKVTPKIVNSFRHLSTTEQSPVVVPSKYICPIRDFKRTFNDLNDLHLRAGKRFGLKEAPANREKIDREKLLKIEDSRFYYVAGLDYSVPYLSRSGKILLDEIAVNFSDSLKSKGITPARLRITSVLRTKEDIKRLRASGNVNASTNSSHCYACTFDISWAKFDTRKVSNANAEQYKGVLAEVLRDLRKEKKCYVKYEQKQACFHITSRIKP